MHLPQELKVEILQVAFLASRFPELVRAANHSDFFGQQGVPAELFAECGDSKLWR